MLIQEYVSVLACIHGYTCMCGFVFACVHGYTIHVENHKYIICQVYHMYACVCVCDLGGLSFCV